MNEINGLSALEFQKIVLSKIDKLSAELVAQREATREFMVELRLRGNNELQKHMIPDFDWVEFEDGTSIFLYEIEDLEQEI